MKNGEAAKGSKSWRRKALSVALQLALLVGVVVVASEWQARHLLARRAPAPALALRTLGGEEVSLEGARGRTVVLYFFAPWCSVCQYSSHNVVALRNARSEREVAIYAVGLDYESPADLERFARDHELNVPVLLGDDDVQRSFNVRSFPTIYVIDEDGRVRDRVIGYTTGLGLRLRSL